VFPARAAPGTHAEPAAIRLSAAGLRQDAILVPQVAVQELQSAKYVLVVDPDNKIVQRTITVGDRIDDSFIVTDGLKAGERVVTEGVQKVRPGMVVKPTTTAGGAS